ncbi:hypothetical protein [Deinococcus aestuarii]|uniref:hypothetical protein n=1 Tax=Deinococcus aestuarii TaxID=2774531 RepID=UPI001C0BCDB1|nr:hypothetical protein [Deinococcus aestuarii]
MHPAPTPPALPLDRAVYTRLHTDHYPWTEVTVDLAARQAGGLSGVFEARQEAGWARFVWVAGTLRGGFTAAGDTAWTAVTAALPRARVTLAELDPAAADLFWSCREEAPEPLAGAWPDARDTLERSGFSGLLLGASACSHWQAGRPVGGTLPPTGAVCHRLSPPGNGGAILADFWAEVIALTHRTTPLDEAWRTVCVRLCAEHPCLDPFAQEVTVQGGRLHVELDLPAGEWRPALLAAYQGTLARLGVRLADLPLAELRGRPAWTAAGLETP